ncbi:hypothetical protein FRC19_004388, partial [Serendipita sp. 401]
KLLEEMVVIGKTLGYDKINAEMSRATASEDSSHFAASALLDVRNDKPLSWR